MKKEHIIQESRHIVAAYTKENQPTGYCIRSKSKVTQALRYILKLRWAEKVDEYDGFVFVVPTDILLNLFNETNQQNVA